MEETTEAMLTMDPPPCASMAGRRARVTRNIERTFTFMLKSQSRGVHSRRPP
jgi:hypothetical protein